MQPPLEDEVFQLDHNDEDWQNDAVNRALEYHMAVKERMEEICDDELKKFYRGEVSTLMDRCNLSCITTDVEKQIVLYVSVGMTVILFIILQC